MYFISIDYSNMDPNYSQDHDLLIELKATLGFLRADVKDLKDNLVSRVTALEIDKIGRVEASRMQAEALLIHNDHETRLRSQEAESDTLDKRQSNFQTRVITWGSAALLVLGLAETLLEIFFKH